MMEGVFSILFLALVSLLFGGARLVLLFCGARFVRVSPSDYHHESLFSPFTPVSSVPE